MSFEIELTTDEGNEIRRLLKENPNLKHLLPEIQFIGSNTNDIRALEFLQQRIEFHNTITRGIS